MELLLGQTKYLKRWSKEVWVYNGSCEKCMQCNIGPNKKYLRWEWRFCCSWTKKIRVFFLFVVVTGRKKEFAGACLMEWNQIKSNQIYIISYLHKKPPQKSFTPPMVCHIVICLLTRVNQHPLAHQARRMMCEEETLFFHCIYVP